MTSSLSRGADLEAIPSHNSRPFVRDGVRARTVGPVIRVGATMGQFLPPRVWRRLNGPLVNQVHKGGEPSRPRLTPEQREILLAPHREASSSSSS